MTTADPRFINGFLAAIGRLNSAINEGHDHALLLLPDAPTPMRALELHFEACCTSRSPPRPASEWKIVLHACEGLAPACTQWFFSAEALKAREARDREWIIADFLAALREAIGPHSVTEVTVAPPMYYNCAWQDFLLEASGQRWLLHFGIDD
jgi:hypothetical protein